MPEAEKLLQNKPWNLQTIFFEHFLTDWPATNVTRLAVVATENFTQPEKSLNENWPNLSEVIKADTLFVQCLIIIQNISTQQAFQRLAAIKQVLHRLLPFHKGGDLTAIWQGLLPNQQRELITDLSIRKYVSNNPGSSYQEAFNYSLPLLKQPTIVSSPSIVELRLYHLKDILDSWVDWQRAKVQLLNPYQILNAVMAQYGRSFPNEFFQPPFDIDRFHNIRFLDEAALLWKQLQKGDMFQGVVENGTFSFSLLEDQYFDALSTAYQRQKIMDKMFLQEGKHNNSQAIYFNGVALKNAQGKLLNDFINCTELEEISDYRDLSSLQRRSLLQEKFHQIGESEQYKIGSLLHSLVSSLQRIYYYQYYQFSALPLYNSQKQLLDLFKHSEEQWGKYKNYPIQPRLLTADNYIKYNFETLFYKCFYPKRFFGASIFDMHSFYRSVYQASPTFRRLFNRFHEVFISAYTDKLWEIRIKPNTITRTDFASNVIHIGADAEIVAKTYFSSQNNFEISHPEQVYLHEMLHALTGKNDPLKLVDIRHRGPIVYLTDKILSEAGYAFPQRIMYRRLAPSDANLEGFELRCKQHREAEKLLVAQENQYLDNFIDNALPVDEYKKIFDEELSARYTIQELNVFFERFPAKPEVSTKVSFEERFLARFSANKKYMNWLLDFYVNLYIKSDTFYHLFEHWYGQLPALEKRWYFELSDSAARAELPVNKQVHAINDLSKKIYIFNDDTLYLTDKGLLPVERTRQLVHEMVQILTEFKDPPADVALKNRGAVVVITDKILNEAVYELDKRLVYGLAKSSDVAKQAILLSYQLEASRAAILEDRLLKNMPIFQGGCTGCRAKRSLLERKYLSKMFNSNLALQQEDIVTEKKKIQNKLKKYGITQALNYVKDENFNLTHKLNITPSFFYKNFNNNALSSIYNITATNTNFFLN